MANRKLPVRSLALQPSQLLRRSQMANLKLPALLRPQALLLKNPMVNRKHRPQLPVLHPIPRLSPSARQMTPSPSLSTMAFSKTHTVEQVTLPPTINSNSMTHHRPVPFTPLASRFARTALCPLVTAVSGGNAAAVAFTTCMTVTGLLSVTPSTFKPEHLSIAHHRRLHDLLLHHYRHSSLDTKRAISKTYFLAQTFAAPFLPSCRLCSLPFNIGSLEDRDDSLMEKYTKLKNDTCILTVMPFSREKIALGTFVFLWVGIIASIYCKVRDEEGRRCITGGGKIGIGSYGS